jgi:hypothetical protein
MLHNAKWFIDNSHSIDNDFMVEDTPQVIWIITIKLLKSEEGISLKEGFCKSDITSKGCCRIFLDTRLIFRNFKEGILI